MHVVLLSRKSFLLGYGAFDTLSSLYTLGCIVSHVLKIKSKTQDKRVHACLTFAWSYSILFTFSERIDASDLHCRAFPSVV